MKRRPWEVGLGKSVKWYWNPKSERDSDLAHDASLVVGGERGGLMKSRLLTDTADHGRTSAESCGKADDICFVTAWATTDCQGFTELTEGRKSVSTLAIGVDFYSTAPLFLTAFRSTVRIGKAPGKSTFHPKVYLFTRGNLLCCRLGSSNSTKGGFGGNSESNAFITGRQSETFFVSISTYIDTQERRADEISSPEIADYRRQFEQLTAIRASLTGTVDQGQFDAFVANYRWERSRAGAAARLLPMKRPDLFVCIDSGDRPEIARAFGVKYLQTKAFLRIGSVQRRRLQLADRSPEGLP